MKWKKKIDLFKRGEIMAEKKERKAVYNPIADKKWAENNRKRKTYLSSRSTARSFIRKKATKEDLEELETLINERKIEFL